MAAAVRMVSRPVTGDPSLRFRGWSVSRLSEAGNVHIAPVLMRGRSSPGAEFQVRAR